MTYATIDLRRQGHVCFLALRRPEANNAINAQMVRDCTEALGAVDASVAVLVLEGGPEVFCSGADFAELRAASPQQARDAGPLYDLWLALASAPFVTIAHVKGKANAGGVGFVAACDIVIAGEHAQFGLSEMLFGLYPACVLPFLQRRIGFQRAHYMTLTTQPISARQAHGYGLVDAVDADSDALLRRHLARLKPLRREAIARYKRGAAGLCDLRSARTSAVAANAEAFGDPRNLESIARFVTTGALPWET